MVESTCRRAAAPAAPAPAPKADKPARKPNPHKLARAEAKVAELEAQIKALDAALADPATHRDPARAAELARQRDALATELAAAEAEWLALMDAA